MESKQPPQQEEQQPVVVLKSAPPPLHSIALLGLMTAVFVHFLPTTESLDQVATPETFTKVLFPQYMDIYTLIYIRFAVATIIFVTSFHTAVISNGWVQATAYSKGSKLKMVDNHMVGWKTMMPFTSMSWNLLGLSYACNAYVALQVVVAGANTGDDDDNNNNNHHRGDGGVSSVSPALLRAALCLWETAAPCTLLVAAVVRYAIWPKILTVSGRTAELKSVRNVLMHNVNVLFALGEVALLGGLPAQWSEMSLAPLYGCCYVLFSWSATSRWNNPEHGPQFIYFFFDTTLPGYTSSIALLVLLAVLLLFHAIFCACDEALIWIDGSFLIHVVLVALVAGSVMRIRD